MREHQEGFSLWDRPLPSQLHPARRRDALPSSTRGCAAMGLFPSSQEHRGDGQCVPSLALVGPLHGVIPSGKCQDSTSPVGYQDLSCLHQRFLLHGEVLGPLVKGPASKARNGSIRHQGFKELRRGSAPIAMPRFGPLLPLWSSEVLLEPPAYPKAQ